MQVVICGEKRIVFIDWSNTPTWKLVSLLFFVFSLVFFLPKGTSFVKKKPVSCDSS